MITIDILDLIVYFGVLGMITGLYASYVLPLFLALTSFFQKICLSQVKIINKHFFGVHFCCSYILACTCPDLLTSWKKSTETQKEISRMMSSHFFFSDGSVF